MKLKKKKQVNYKQKYLSLKDKYNALVLKNSISKLIYEPTPTQKIEIIDNYYSFICEEELDANDIHTFYAYKQKLKN